MEPSKKPRGKTLACLSLLSTLTFMSCVPEVPVPENEEVTETKGQGPETHAPPGPAGDYLNELQTIAANSLCAGHVWPGRGRAPAAYTKGMALTYARSYCRLKNTQDSPSALVVLLSAGAGNPAVDALAHYKMSSPAGSEALLSLYTLGMGLGMRESSGKYCEGRDMSASNTSADTAEAGLFQTSYNSMSAGAELKKLYAEYKADISKCFLEVFKQGVSCGPSSIAGSGPGAEYQAFNKSCPAFAAEYAMVVMRIRRTHYGPINRKEAAVVPACRQMLEDIQDYIDADPYACEESPLAPSSFPDAKSPKDFDPK